MKRKPDILWVLVLIFGLGVVTTGYTQSLWERQSDASVAPVVQQQSRGRVRRMDAAQEASSHIPAPVRHRGL